MANAFALRDLMGSFLLGASIHDVAQALVAGYFCFDAGGGIATIVRLPEAVVALSCAATRRVQAPRIP